MAFTRTLDCLRKQSVIGKGKKVAVAVGSRGIRDISELVAGVVDAVRSLGGSPVVIPAMGSHGGDSHLGKSQILAHLGVTKEKVGAPISQTAKVVQAGKTEEGLPVFCQAEAFAADAIILINRIKPHTDFHGKIESGLVKMALIGLGGSLGASWLHEKGYDELPGRVQLGGDAALRTLPICMGLAVVERYDGAPAHIEAVPNAEIFNRERVLLEKAREILPRLPLRQLDALIVAEMGKDISGLGLDPAVTGRYPGGKPAGAESLPDFYRIAVLDLTDASMGNASGIGLCDVTTKRLFDKIDFEAMYRNVITSKGSASARLPMIMQSDREAICVALLTCKRDPASAEIAFIQNTLDLEFFLVSQTLAAGCEALGAQVFGEPVDLTFDEDGSLVMPEILKTSSHAS